MLWFGPIIGLVFIDLRRDPQSAYRYLTHGDLKSAGHIKLVIDMHKLVDGYVDLVLLHCCLVYELFVACHCPAGFSECTSSLKVLTLHYA
jgi:hypothetical protein